MEEKIKGIVSVFIKLPAEQIGAGTPIDRSALQSSILLHRMYAKLAEEGVRVENYANIKVFGDLLQQQGDNSGNNSQPAGMIAPLSIIAGIRATPAIGIDIEEVAALPKTTDFRKAEFYTMNFTPAEIAYCILQPDPYSSFAGLFAAKEAIIKADGRYRAHAFNTLEIGHSAEGAPLHPGFGLSISHANGMAAAVAIAAGAGPLIQPTFREISPAARAARSGNFAAGPMAWIAWIALLLAVVALWMALKL
jgi:phosphopantetheine--protein transferase-like protein